MDPAILKAIQILALYEAEQESYNAFYDRICRWYSREFSTPLSDVEAMSEEKVLKVYYQDIVAKLSEDTSEEGKQHYEEFRKRVVNPDVVKKETDEDDAWEEEMNKKIEQEQAAKPEEKSVPEPNLVAEDHQDIIMQGEDGPPDFSEE